jgi:putative Ca2+/H+ antiporter (TMEM165/GDT1 family)
VQSLALQAFLVSTGAVALAEVGDKTQLLAFVLAARFRRSVPIILGIVTATLANHALAGGLGLWLAWLTDPRVLRWLVGLLFLAMALWALKPDRLDGDEARVDDRGVFTATLVSFFLVEMGDKTQVATIALAARYQELAAVVAGTTLGMLAANAPVAVLGGRIGHRLPVRIVRLSAALLFAVLGLATLAGLGDGLATRAGLAVSQPMETAHPVSI